MQRMLESLSDRLALVVALNTEGAKTWNGRVRAVSLNKPDLLPRKILRHLHIVNESSSEKILMREINRSGVTHVFCQYGTFATSFMTVWQNTNIPLFVHFHGYDATFDLHPSSDPNVRVHSEDYLSNILLLSQKAFFIANSSFTKNQLIHAGVDPRRIIIKYLGVPIPKFQKTHSSTEQLTILHVGRLVDFKSPDRTIKAFEIARSKGLNAKLIIVGDGPLKLTCELERIRSRYKESITLLGAVEPNQVQKLMETADIYTQHNIKGEITAQEEALGVSIMEAMSYGLPIVGTKSGGVIETVIDGKTGILVQPGDINSQAEALLVLGKNSALRQKIGEEGRKHMSVNFSLEKEKLELDRIFDYERKTGSG